MQVEKKVLGCRCLERRSEVEPAAALLVASLTSMKEAEIRSQVDASGLESELRAGSVSSWDFVSPRVGCS